MSKDSMWPYDPGSALNRWGDDAAKWVNPNRTTTKAQAPYGYDEFFIFGNRDIIETAPEAYYSDRLQQNDRDKFSRLWDRHLRTSQWVGAGAKTLSAFMTEYLGRNVTVVALAEGCNCGNGYPYWIVWLEPVKPSE
jgi:hypothetical protein